MYDYHTTAGFDIIDLGNDQWIFDVKEVQKYHGTLKEVIKFAVKKYNFKLSEIEYGLTVMNQIGHNTAHFGILGTFILSRYTEISFDKDAA